MKWNVVGSMALFVFILIASSYNTELAKEIDRRAAEAIQGNQFLEAFHIIGNTETIIGITLLFVILLLILKKAWQAAIFSVLSVALGYGLNQLLKRIFERPRPDVVEQLTSFSFPSGHSMATTVCLLTLVFVSQQVFFANRRLYGAYAAALIMSILVALSRVAGARHFFTDIVAGVSLGIALVVAIAYVYKKWLR